MNLNQRVVIEPRQAVRQLRLVWTMMLFSLGLYVVVLRIISSPTVIHNSPTIPLDHTFQYGVLACGIATGLVVWYLRFVRLAGLSSVTGQIDEKTLVRSVWATHILCFVCAEATFLFGFALAFLHGEFKLYVPLYLGGVLLMLLCYPRLPSNP
jgi:hypothetical protein